MHKNKGFTLVELLAVIVVLAIILTIAIPNILDVILNAKFNTYERQKEIIINAAEKYVIKNEKDIVWINNTTTVYLKDLQDDNILDNPTKDPRGGNFDNRKPEGTKVIITKEGYKYTYDIIAISNTDITPPIITLIGSPTININEGDLFTDNGATALDNIDGNITNKIVTNNTVNPLMPGTYTITYDVKDNAGNNATQVKRTIKVLVVNYSVTEGINKPKLITGMTPIKWNGTTWIDTTISDPDWYSYTTVDKKWANVRTMDGSMWVWIPRYAYQITANYHSNSVGNIDIKFLKDTTNVASDNSVVTTTPNYSGNNQTNFILHPAFTLGTTGLTGIWVAKFEASVSNINDLCYTAETVVNCNKTTLILKIIPNVKTWRNITIGNMFTVTRNMETNNTYGWGTTGNGFDTHMMKNTEWGGLTYLAQSSYGKKTKIWVNPNSNNLTGCAGDSASSSPTASCKQYHTSDGVNSSTTGNIYGVYGMNGGSIEYVAAYVNNGHANLATYGSSILSADSKYKDIYPVTADGNLSNYTNAAAKKGDALYETSSTSTGETSWNTESSDMPYSTLPWFARGGYYSNSVTSGIFHFDSQDGNASNLNSFRPVLAIDDSL